MLGFVNECYSYNIQFKREKHANSNASPKTSVYLNTKKKITILFNPKCQLRKR